MNSELKYIPLFVGHHQSRSISLKQNNQIRTETLKRKEKFQILDNLVDNCLANSYKVLQNFSLSKENKNQVFSASKEKNNQLFLPLKEEIQQIKIMTPKKTSNSGKENNLDDLFHKALTRSEFLINKHHSNKKISKTSIKEKKSSFYIPDCKTENLKISLFDSNIPNKKLLNLDFIKFYEKEFDGTYLDNLKTGFGNLKTKEGELIYSGEWLNNLFEGQGVLNNIIKNPQRKFEKFNYENFNLLFDFWDYYEGEYKNGQLEGFGMLYLKNGEKINGKFKNGYLSGQATFYNVNNEAIIGKWENNKLDANNRCHRFLLVSKSHTRNIYRNFHKTKWLRNNCSQYRQRRARF